MTKKIWQLFYSPDPATGLSGAVLDNDPSKTHLDDDTDLLADLIDKKPAKDKDKDNNDNDNNDDDDNEEENDDNEEDDNEEDDNDDDDDDDDDDDEKEDDDLIIDSDRKIDLKKIKDKFPEFAKTNEFKQLRDAFYRESKFQELFPTLEDAQEAAENNETFTKLNADLMSGDPTSLVEALKKEAPDSLKKVAFSFLDTVFKADPNIYVEAVTPILKRSARQMLNDAEKMLKHDPESKPGLILQATAKNVLAFYEIDEKDLDKDSKPAEKSEKEKELDAREQKIENEKYQSALNLAWNSAEKRLENMIADKLDPDNRFSEFTRDTLIEKIMNEVKSQINKDQPHLRKMESLWKRARSSGYSRESLSSIVSAYLERARPIIPEVRNKYRSKALKDSRRSNDDDDDKSNKNDKSARLPRSGRSGKSSNNDGRVNMRAVDPKKIDWSKTSDDDILNGRITSRK